MFRRIVGETIFEALIVAMAILVSITTIMMTFKLQQVFGSTYANEYEQVVDDLQMPREVWDEKAFKKNLDSMNAI